MTIAPMARATDSSALVVVSESTTTARGSVVGYVDTHRRAFTDFVRYRGEFAGETFIHRFVARHGGKALFAAAAAGAIGALASIGGGVSPLSEAAAYVLVASLVAFGSASTAVIASSAIERLTRVFMHNRALTPEHVAVFEKAFHEGSSVEKAVLSGLAYRWLSYLDKRGIAGSEAQERIAALAAWRTEAPAEARDAANRVLAVYDAVTDQYGVPASYLTSSDSAVVYERSYDPVTTRFSFGDASFSFTRHPTYARSVYRKSDITRIADALEALPAEERAAANAMVRGMLFSPRARTPLFACDHADGWTRLAALL